MLNFDLRSGLQRLRALAAHGQYDGFAARRARVGDIESGADYILSLGRLP